MGLDTSNIKIREALKTILDSSRPAAKDGQRIAAYYRLMFDLERPEDGKEPVKPEVETLKWLRLYGSFKNTPEGCAIRYLRADTLLAKSDAVKDDKIKREMLDEASQLFHDLEHSDSEYTDRAAMRRLLVIDRQGGFTKNVGELASFDDCFVRSKFELYEIGEDAKAILAKIDENTKKMEKAKEEERQELIKENQKLELELENKRVKRLETAVSALERGLSLPDAKNAKDAPVARSMIAFYCLSNATPRQPSPDWNEQKRNDWNKQEQERVTANLRKAAEVGEKFARDNPKANTADNAALYALDARTRLASGKGPDDPDYQALLNLAGYVETAFPNTHAGYLARHRVALVQLADKTGGLQKREQNVQEGLLRLRSLDPKYAGIMTARFQLAETALKAEEEKLAPPLVDGKPMSYRDLALEALRSIPDMQTGDPDTLRVFYLSRIKLANQLMMNPGLVLLGIDWDREKKYKSVDDLVTPLLARLDAKPPPALSDEDSTNKKARDYVRAELHSLQLRCAGGLSAAELEGGTEAKVNAAAKRINVIVDRMAAGQEQELLTNPQWGQMTNALLSISLRANIQTNNAAQVNKTVELMVGFRTEQSLQAFKTETEKNAARPKAREAASLEALKQVVSLARRQIDDLTSRNDQDGLGKFKGGMAKVFADLAKGGTSTDVGLTYGQGLIALGDLPTAEKVLAAVKDPGPDALPAEIRGYQGAAVLHLQTLRLQKKFADAENALKPLLAGWGAKSIDVLKEQVLLEADQEKYGAAFRHARGLVEALDKYAASGGAARAHYLDCYYQMALCSYKYGKGQNKPDNIDFAGYLIAVLERKYPDYGGEPWKTRFEELLKSDPMVKVGYDKEKRK
jgi:hypothetical protein